MRSKFGWICMVLGAVLIVAALSLLLWNQYEDQQAGLQADQVIAMLENHVTLPPTRPTEPLPPDPEDPSGAADDLPPPLQPTVPGEKIDPTMTEVEIDGHSYIGYVTLPSLNLKLPVMSDWSYRQLKTAPCRYYGSSKTDNLVIMAHNYTRHFGRIKNLKPGDQVIFTDMDGVKILYEVIELETLGPKDIGKMNAGEYDLTLFTCTYGGETRVTVRCDRVVVDPKSEDLA